MINYVNTIKDLNKICAFIKKNNIDRIAVDTEFIRHFTYYPKLSLIQLMYNFNDENFFCIIDVLCINDIGDFKKILKSKKIKKIFFSFYQDIDAIYYYTKYVNNVEDIQLLMEFCGFYDNLSYKNAIEFVLGIDFYKNKEIQSSNWEKRPLDNKHIEYAANDVKYLFELYDNIYNNIKKENYKYYQNEISYILKFKKEKYLINNAWKKSKFLLHKKNIEYVLLFKEISKWRENTAIKENKIRNLIVTDDILDIIIKNKPFNIKDLKKLYSYKDILNLRKEYKESILEIINSFYNSYKKNFSNQTFYMIEKGFPYKKKMLEIYENVKKISNENNISIEKTISKTDIIFLIMKYENKKSILYGWKYELFGNIFNIYNNVL